MDSMLISPTLNPTDLSAKRLEQTYANRAAGTASNAHIQASHMVSKQGAIDPRKQREIEQAAQEFESVFIAQMLEHMFAGIETNELFGGGFAEDIYRSMMVEEYGKIISRAGGVGIADHVIRELQQVQEVQDESTAVTARLR